MSEYTITIDGYKSGLTAKTVEQQFRESIGSPDADVQITVTESDT